jgi:hypothetical protein
MSMTYYEAQTFLGLSVSRCWTYVSVWHRHDTHTYNHIESCYFLNLLLVSACQCLYHVWCLCLYSFFIDGILCLISHCTILGFCNIYSQELLQFAKVICLKVWGMFLYYLRYVMMVGTCCCLNHQGRIHIHPRVCKWTPWTLYNYTNNLYFNDLEHPEI